MSAVMSDLLDKLDVVKVFAKMIIWHYCSSVIVGCSLYSESISSAT